MAVFVSIAMLGAAPLLRPQSILHGQLTYSCASCPQPLSATYEDDTLPPKSTGQVRSDSLNPCELNRSSPLDSLKPSSEVYRSSSLR